MVKLELFKLFYDFFSLHILNQYIGELFKRKIKIPQKGFENKLNEKKQAVFLLWNVIMKNYVFLKANIFGGCHLLLKRPLELWSPR